MGRPLSVLLLAALMTIACTQQVSKEDYVADVNRLCDETRRELDAYGASLRNAASVDEVRAAVERGRAIFERFRGETVALEKPEEDRALLDRWLAAIDEVVDLMRRLEKATESGDIGAIDEIAQAAESAQTEGDALATDYGIDACAG
ncbi:MAG: hypothetical protein M3516_08665 [Actinomycetota bacterium]|nr:hypothetical protein [Actinomycetota bacterium]